MSTATIQEELDKLKASKTQIRKAIQRKETGLTLDNIYSEYPDYIYSITPFPPTVDTTDLLDYCEDGTSVFTITADSGITTIREYAFANYTALEALVIKSTSLVELQNKNAFTDTPIASGIGYIYVPTSLLSTYKSATNWSNFADQILDSSSVPTEETTYLIEHEETCGGRTVEWVETLTLEELTTDNR